MNRYLPFIIVIIGLAGLPAFAQTPVLVNDPVFQDDARAAIDSLYNRKPEAADAILESWRQRYPDHPVWSLFEAMDLWWVVLSDLDDHRYDEELFERMEMADQKADELLDEEPDHPDGLIVKAVANGYIARQLSNRDRWFASVRTARRAQNAHERLGEVAPDLSDNLFAEGLKKYYAAYLPEAYPIVRAIAWLLPSGDKERGLELLEITSREAIFARPESIYFLGNISLNYEQDYAGAAQYFSQLVEMYPDNSYYRRLLVRAYFQHDDDRLAMEAISSALEHWEAHDLQNHLVMKEELIYWRGRIHMESMRYSEALEDLEESFRTGEELPNTSLRSIHAYSGYYAGVSAERTNDMTKARDYFGAVTNLDAEKEIRRRADDRLDELP